MIGCQWMQHGLSSSNVSVRGDNDHRFTALTRYIHLLRVSEVPTSRLAWGSSSGSGITLEPFATYRQLRNFNAS